MRRDARLPRQGSVTWIVLRKLEEMEPGAELSRQAIADLAQVGVRQVTALMAWPVRVGYLVRRDGGPNLFSYSLPVVAFDPSTDWMDSDEPVVHRIVPAADAPGLFNSDMWPSVFHMGGRFFMGASA